MAESNGDDFSAESEWVSVLEVNVLRDFTPVTG